MESEQPILRPVVSFCGYFQGYDTCSRLLQGGAEKLSALTVGFSTHFHQREPYQASSRFIDGLQKPQQTADLLAFLTIPGGFNSRRLHQLDQRFQRT